MMTSIEEGALKLKGDEEVASPATTPGSVVDDKKFLVVVVKTKRKARTPVQTILKLVSFIPFGIVTVSILQIVVHLLSFTSLDVKKVLRFEPSKPHDIWRFATYMLVHDDWFHLILNVVMQCIFAVCLEHSQGRWRVVVVYLFSGITGAFGASCIHPDLVIGGSAGVYGLLSSHLSDLLINYKYITYKCYRTVCIFVIVASDVVYNILHFCSQEEPLISWGAHLVGGLAGLMIALIVFKSNARYSDEHTTKMYFWIGLMSYALLMFVLVIITYQIKKCTPLSVIRRRYVYIC